MRRVGHVATCEGHDRAGHRGAEQHRLARRRCCTHQGFDIWKEAHVEHFVGLIKHECAHLREREVLLFEQVDQTSGGADDDVDAIAQRLNLRFVSAAAIHGEDADALALACEFEIAGNLQTQFARGDDHECLRHRFALDNALQQWNAETECLAGAGFCLTDEVIAGECKRKCLCLDWECVGDAGAFQRSTNFGIDTEVDEEWALQDQNPTRRVSGPEMSTYAMWAAGIKTTRPLVSVSFRVVPLFNAASTAACSSSADEPLSTRISRCACRIPIRISMLLQIR